MIRARLLAARQLSSAYGRVWSSFLILLALVVLGGCYRRVVSTGGGDSDRIVDVYEPNRADADPDWLDELMWGPPPKGTTARDYYRSKQSP